MSDLADLGLRFHTEGGEQAVSTLDQVATKAERAERATDSLAKGSSRASRATDALAGSSRSTAQAVGRLAGDLANGGSATEALGRSLPALAGGLGALQGVHTKGAAGAKLHAHEMLNLSRQFADVGVAAAMGMNPLMILIQQGPQIGETLAMASARGITLSAVLRQVAAAAWAAVAPIAPFLAGAAAIAAVVGGGLALATRSFNKDNADLIKGLGLTEKQLEKVKEKGVTMGDVLTGTFAYIGKAIGPALKPVGDFISDLLDKITAGFMTAIKGIVGAFVGGFRAIQATWKMLPAAIGDAAISAANAAITAVERMINGVIIAFNALRPALNVIARMNGLPLAIPELGKVDLGELKNQYTGAMRDIGKAGAQAFLEGSAEGGAWVDKHAKGLRASIMGAWEARVRKDAGDAANGPKGRKGAADPRDMTDERTAQIDAMIAQAAQEELQARLAITRDVEERARLQKQMIAAEVAEKTAQVNRQAAAIVDDKGLSDATKHRLLLELEFVKVLQARTAAHQASAIDEATANEAARERTRLATAEHQVAIDLLASQMGLATTAAARETIDEKILEHAREIERLRLREIIDTKGISKERLAQAKKELGLREEIWANEDAAARSMHKAYRDTADAVRDAARAFEEHDWYGMVQGLQEAFDRIKKVFSDSASTFSTKVGAIAGVANMVGQAVGGTAGSGISGAASGAMAGTMILPGIGTAIGAVVGGIFGLFSGNKAKKEQQRQEAERRAQEEAARQAAILNQKRDLELELLRMTGTAAEVLAAERARELEGIDASNQALQLRIYALQDEKAAADAAAAAAAKLQEARAYFDANFLTDAERIAPVMARVTESLTALGLAGVDTIEKFKLAVLGADQATDAGRELYAQLLTIAPDFKAVMDYQDKLAQATSAAADTASRAFSDAIGKWADIADKLRDYAKSLAGQSAAIASPLTAYGQTRAALEALAPRIRQGDAAAMLELEGVGNAFIEAARLVSTDSLDEIRAIARVRGLALEGEGLARAQSGEAYQQTIANNTAETNTKIAALLDQIARLQTQLQEQAGRNDARVATLERVILGLESGDVTISTEAA